jgi:hypothetical protein
VGLTAAFDWPDAVGKTSASVMASAAANAAVWFLMAILSQ